MRVFLKNPGNGPVDILGLLETLEKIDLVFKGAQNEVIRQAAPAEESRRLLYTQPPLPGFREGFQVSERQVFIECF